MSKPPVRHSLPVIAASALEKLGADLAIARVRRNESQRLWAKRLGVSIPTLIRLERGEPGVGIGIYAAALWMIGRVQALAALADPKQDQGALEREVRTAEKRRAIRSATSIRARLSKGSSR